MQVTEQTLSMIQIVTVTFRVPKAVTDALIFLLPVYLKAQ